MCNFMTPKGYGSIFVNSSLIFVSIDDRLGQKLYITFPCYLLV